MSKEKSLDRPCLVIPVEMVMELAKVHKKERVRQTIIALVDIMIDEVYGDSDEPHSN